MNSRRLKSFAVLQALGKAWERPAFRWLPPFAGRQKTEARELSLAPGPASELANRSYKWSRDAWKRRLSSISYPAGRLSRFCHLVVLAHPCSPTNPSNRGAFPALRRSSSTHTWEVMRGATGDLLRSIQRTDPLSRPQLHVHVGYMSLQ